MDRTLRSSCSIRAMRFTGSSAELLLETHRELITSTRTPTPQTPVFKLHYGDLTDTSNLTRLIRDIEPDEIYNLGAQSHVAVSFEAPEYTADVDAIGTLRILEAIRFLGLEQKTRFYQASTSELFGLVQETPQRETTPFYPRSPYAVAKMYAYWIAVNYRESYGMYACNGILFNHESPRRGETFVTRKITRGLSNIALGLEDCLYMGNIDSLRDWGHAKDYVRMQWMMLQQDTPEDFVIATGVQYSVREFIQWSGRELGLTIEFSGAGLRKLARSPPLRVTWPPPSAWVTSLCGSIRDTSGPQKLRPCSVIPPRQK